MAAFNNRNTQETAGQLHRSCINEKQTFTVKLLFRNGMVPSLRDALIAFGMLGGLGSRSRHGLGSVALVKIREYGEDTWVVPQTADEYRTTLMQLIKTCCTSQSVPPCSAFSGHSRIDNLLVASNPYDALDMFGKAMLLYRSWGRHGQVLGASSEKRFQDDHDWFRNAATFRNNNPEFHPKRVVFGLPHNYWQHPDTHITPENHERRSSPLLFHVHPVDTQFVGVTVLLKSQFLPTEEKINAGGKMVPAEIDWSVITNFLDGKVGNPPLSGAADRFPSKTQVIP